MIDYNNPDEALEIMLAQDKQLVAIFNRNHLNDALQKLKNWHQTWDGWASDKITENKPATVTQQALNEVMYRDLFRTTSIYGTDSHLAVSTVEVPLVDPYMPAAPSPTKSTSKATKKAAKKTAAPPNPFDGKPK